METITACFCCRKKIHKRNEFQGLEGMVKLKNPEDNNLVEANNTDVENVNSALVLQIENSSSTNSNGDIEAKRASSVPQRSLPDIPTTEPTGNNDNYSDLYATVADKVEGKPSPTPSLKKQTSISQHSSISQADVNSPYATVKNPTHGYDKVRKGNEEHPYAQLNAPTTSRNCNNIGKENPYENTDDNDGVIVPSIKTTQTDSESSLAESENSAQENIPAAAAMLGMISASQELPYMTPPIVPQPNFSGDSQDSSKGYTSISVREPLANIIAQTKQQQRLSSKQKNDSHYATVSDDSDEMYAAIEDPKQQSDIYNSGSETYAQIQPNNQLITVQINNQQHQVTTASTSGQSITISTVLSNSLHRNGFDSFELSSVNSQQASSSQTNNTSITSSEQTPIPPSVDTLFAMHSRQASSSSNVSYIGNIGSPKPEKRQANSPLPPTPKNGNSFSNLSNQSGRNSVVVEESPPKDIDGMYAKVMKKGKYANCPSQSNSPILNRRQINSATDKISELTRSNSFKQAENGRPRSDSFDKKNGNCLNFIENRKSEGGYSVVRNLFQDSMEIIAKPNVVVIEPGYESLPDASSLNTNDPGYETLMKNPSLSVQNNGKGSKPNSDYDPNYEVLHPLGTKKMFTNTSGDDGYAKVLEKPIALIDENRLTVSSNIEDDDISGYSKVKEKIDKDDEDDAVDGYSKVKERKETLDDDDILAGYSRVKERQIHKEDDEISDGYSKVKECKNCEDDESSPGYSRVKEKKIFDEDSLSAGYSKVKEHKKQIELDDETVPGYSQIKELPSNKLDSKNHRYASISETRQSYVSGNFENQYNNNNNNNNNVNMSTSKNSVPNNNNNVYVLEDNPKNCMDIYSTIDKIDDRTREEINMFDEEHKYSTIGNKNNSGVKTNFINNAALQEKLLESMEPPPLPPVGTRSPDLLQTNMLENTINYRKKENPYEKVKDITDIQSNDTNISKTLQENGSVLVVDDYFQV